MLALRRGKCGSAIGLLANKVEGLQQQLMEFQNHIQKERNERSEALFWIKHIDEVKDL